MAAGLLRVTARCPGSMRLPRASCPWESKAGQAPKPVSACDMCHSSSAFPAEGAVPCSKLQHPNQENEAGSAPLSELRMLQAPPPPPQMQAHPPPPQQQFGGPPPPQGPPQMQQQQRPPQGPPPQQFGGPPGAPPPAPYGAPPPWAQPGGPRPPWMQVRVPYYPILSVFCLNEYAQVSAGQYLVGDGWAQRSGAASCGVTGL